MKTLKRMLSLILVIAVLITSVAVFADEATSGTATEVAQEETSTLVREFPDVSSTDEYYDAVQILNKLGVIKGYDDGTFGPMKNVTRAEFATMIIRFLGMESSISNSKENLPFPDIENVEWAIGNIRAAKNLGIINGYDDGTFKPNNNVSFEEAVKMVICTLGYENFTPAGNMWYDKYINSAAKLGLLVDVEGTIKTPATRSCISQLLYNSLEVDLMENNEIKDTNPLEAYFGIYTYKGVITSNGLTSTSDSEVSLNDNTVLIDDRDFYVENPEEYVNLMGLKVVAYYRKNRKHDMAEIVILKPLSNMGSKINVKDITAASASRIEYYLEEEDETKSVKLEENNVVIYNGRLYGEDEEDSKFYGGMLPEIGTIEFVDTNKNGMADVIYLEAYEMYYVSLITSATYTITDKLTPTRDDKQRTLDLEAEEHTNKNDDFIPDREIYFYDANGAETTFSKIKKDNVLAVRETTDGEVVKVTILTKNVTGKVGSVKSGHSAVIEGTKYDLSYGAPWFNGLGDKMPEPEKEDEGKFYFDINGDIFLYDKSAVKHTFQYGYLLKLAIDEDDEGDEYMQAKVLTSSGSQEIIDFRKTTKLNGEAIGEDYEAVKDMFIETAKLSAIATDEDMEEKQVIKYTTVTKNGAKTFDKIVTVTEDSLTSEKPTVEDDVLTKNTNYEGSENATYSSSYLKVGSYSVKLSGTKVFIVPKAEDIDNFKKYKVGSTSSLDKEGNTVEVFDASSTGVKVVVIYGASSAQPVKYNTAVCRIVEEYTSEEDDNGKAYYSIKVDPLNNGDDKATTYKLSKETISLAKKLKPGDLVRFGLDEEGLRTIEEEYVLYSYQEKYDDEADYSNKYMSRGSYDEEDEDMEEFFFYTDDNDDKFDYKYLYDDNYEPGMPGDPLYGRKEESSQITMTLIHGWIFSTDNEEVFITVKVEDGEVEHEGGYIVELDHSNFSSCQFYQYTMDGDDFECTRLDDKESSPYNDLIEGFATYEEYEEDATEVIAYLTGTTVKALFVIE